MYSHGTWTQWSWVESHMWPQQTWGQRSSRGQWPLVQVFGKKGQCIHILWCIFKSNITMIAYSMWSRKQARLVVREPPCFQNQFSSAPQRSLPKKKKKKKKKNISNVCKAHLLQFICFHGTFQFPRMTDKSGEGGLGALPEPPLLGHATVYIKWWGASNKLASVFSGFFLRIYR